jgi:alkylation response protein AidB-like acyl-CoA dehydrogenase
MDFALTDEQVALQTLAREFAEAHLRPITAARDRMVETDPDIFPWDVLREASRVGLRTLTLPRDEGGSGAGILTHVVVLEELMAVDPGFTAVLHQGWKLAHLIQHGTNAAQRKHLLRRFRDDGTCTMTIGMTEPAAGTDNILPYDGPDGGMITRAERAGNGWVLNGVKHYIACAAIAKVHFVLARTDFSVGVTRGTTMFFVESGTPGFRIGKVHEKVGGRLLMNGELVFENCRLPDENVLGRVGDGVPLMSRTFAKHVPTTASFAVGMARAAFALALAYAKARVQGGRPIIEHPAVAMRLGEMYADLEASRAIVLRAAWCADHQDPYDPKEGLVAKLVASEMAPRVCASAMQILGGAGYMKEIPVERYLRDALMCYHIDGLQDVVRHKIGNLLAGKPHSGAL